MHRRLSHALLILLQAATLITASCPSLADTAKPNIIFILCDDLGYGDLRCLNPEGKIATPHFDRLAKEGMIFTDAHSGSSVCTPTRYGVLTGRYAWRTKLQQSVLGGLSPRLIEQDRLTVANLLQQQGYHTACIGKWHLGMDWVRTGDVSELSIETPEQVRNVDYSKPITNGPLSVGFQHYFGISASLDMVPYCFIENDRVTNLPTETLKLAMNAAPAKNTFTREGPASPGFKGEDVLPTFTRKTVEFIQSRAKAAKEGQPFFLYLPLNSPHTPILPSASWQGKSGISLYADFVMETDDTLGQVMRATEETGIARNTLIIITSDNGCSPSADYPNLAKHGHNPSANLRGTKADIFEGGHRVPFITRWPARIKPGTTSTQLVCLTDFMATTADILKTGLPANAAEDSFSFLPALLQETSSNTRPSVVHHSINGSFALREGPWKLELCPGSGGWSDPRPGAPDEKGLPITQLYQLDQDLGEKNNVQAQHPEIVSRLTTQLEKLVADGRSTPGPAQKNAVEVILRKPIPVRKAKAK